MHLGGILTKQGGYASDERIKTFKENGSKEDDEGKRTDASV